MRVSTNLHFFRTAFSHPEIVSKASSHLDFLFSKQRNLSLFSGPFRSFPSPHPLYSPTFHHLLEKPDSQFHHCFLLTNLLLWEVKGGACLKNNITNFDVLLLLNASWQIHHQCFKLFVKKGKQLIQLLFFLHNFVGRSTLMTWRSLRQVFMPKHSFYILTFPYSCPRFEELTENNHPTRFGISLADFLWYK